MEVRSELWCHGCDSYVQFTLDDSLNGNHIIICPKCKHEHFRNVEDGKIGGVGRVMSVKGYTFETTNVTCSAGSSYDLYKGGANETPTGGTFTYQSWMNTTSTGG